MSKFTESSNSCGKMPVRRLRLDYSDDEENERSPSEAPPPPAQSEMQDEFQAQQQIVTIQPQNPSQFPSEPLQISDDDEFIDVSDNLSPPSPPPALNSGPQVVPPTYRSDSGCPISDSLCRLGLSLKTEWVEACIRELESSVGGFAGFDVTTKAKLCFGKFLFSDMNYCGSGILPPNVECMHLVDLPGPYVLQVDEIINVSCPLRARYQQAPPGLKRCLKLSMTDGIQRVFGMEYRPINALEVCASAGLKVAISNVHVRHGLLMLVPETIEILGGLVEELDAARKRLVDELNKPPRGKRTKNGVLPPLAARATLAAWPSNGVDNIGQNNSTLRSIDSIQGNNQGASLSISGTGNTITTEDTFPIGVQNAASHSIREMVSNAEAMHMDRHRDTNPMSNENSMANHIVEKAEEMHISTLNINRLNCASNHSVHMVSNVPVAHTDVIHIGRESSVAAQGYPVAQNVEDTDRVRIPAITESDPLSRASSIISNVDDIHMVDATDHPLILSGDKEIPFTYLASLSAKWAAVKEKAPFVQGKIKCFLTGVKGFQYKKRTTYELQAYIDDGSLISEILVDHNVVQKGIGYSPEEVTAALSSPNMTVVQNMRETLRKFQAFLANFEGVMLVELNGNSSLPHALEMSQGCPQSDVWLLFRRLKSLFPAQIQKRPFDPIDLSP